MTTVANAMSEHDEFTPRSRYHLLLFEAVSRWSCFITKPFPLCFIAASRGQMCQDCQRALNKSSMSSISHQSERLPRQILTRSFVKPRITIAAKDHALSPRSDGPGERMHQLTNKQIRECEPSKIFTFVRGHGVAAGAGRDRVAKA